MKFRKERRKFNYFVAVGTILILIAAIVSIIKYYNPQSRYNQLLKSQTAKTGF